LSQIQPTLKRADRLIVHQAADAQRLHEMGLVDNVKLVAQGTGSPPAVTSAQVRAAAELDERPTLATFGFLLPHKGFIELLQVVDDLRREFPDICLLAPCARHPDDFSGYEERVREQIATRGLQEHVLLITEYLQDHTARAILSAADVLVLPYLETEESSSAALRFVLPVGRPIVATDLPIFADAGDALLLADPADPTGLEECVRRVLMDRSLQVELAAKAVRAAGRFRWSRAVADHREIYAAARSASRGRR
jgi:glycosyltransferase involved in cell wall biosynthesis